MYVYFVVVTSSISWLVNVYNSYELMLFLILGRRHFNHECIRRIMIHNGYIITWMFLVVGLKLLISVHFQIPNPRLYFYWFLGSPNWLGIEIERGIFFFFLSSIVGVERDLKPGNVGLQGFFANNGYFWKFCKCLMNLKNVFLLLRNLPPL